MPRKLTLALDLKMNKNEIHGATLTAIAGILNNILFLTFAYYGCQISAFTCNEAYAIGLFLVQLLVGVVLFFVLVVMGLKLIDKCKYEKCSLKQVILFVFYVISLSTILVLR